MNGDVRYSQNCRFTIYLDQFFSDAFNVMYQSVDQVLSQLPPEYQGDLLPSIREEFLRQEKTVVVFDDDPTGTQTCHDVTVLTSWTLPLLVRELEKKPSILFILTNSRSLTEENAVRLNSEIAGNLNEAVRRTRRKIMVISRSDSTLRGHFPTEVETIANTLQIRGIWILIPAFIEGGRFTIEDVHYLQERGELVPVAETPFARDTAFGYQNSNLRAWILEKSKGKIGSTEIFSCSLDDIRKGGPAAVAKILSQREVGEIVIINAASYKDLEVLSLAVQFAERSGKKFIFRSSATFVSILAGISPGKIFTPSTKDVGANGSLVVVGSYVPKTTSQLSYLLGHQRHEVIEIDVESLLNDNATDKKPGTIIEQTDRWLSSGKDVVIYTSRELRAGSNAEMSLLINSKVSSFLVDVVKGLTVRPSFLIAKGGITSSDLASKALSSESALILGQAIAGVPVWRLASVSKFAEMTYVVFPGNVGDTTALWVVWNKFKSVV